MRNFYINLKIYTGVFNNVDANSLKYIVEQDPTKTKNIYPDVALVIYAAMIPWAHPQSAVEIITFVYIKVLMYKLYYRLCSCSIWLKITINMQQLWLSSTELAWAACWRSATCDFLRLCQSFGQLSPICSAFVHINSLNWIWKIRTWPAHMPLSCKTNSHTYPPS